jgi:hypothetical protein
MNLKTHTALNVPKALRERLRRRTAKGESYAHSLIRSLDIEDLVAGGILGAIRCELCKGVARFAARSLAELVDHVRDKHPEVLKH